MSTERNPSWQAFLASLNTASVGVTLALGGLAALILSPIFLIPFTVLLGRTLFVAVVLLLVHAAARQWPPRWLPRFIPDWLVPMAAVAFTAPLATLLVYLVAVGGQASAFFGVPERVSGFFFITGAGLILGLLLAAGATVREKLAQAQSQALQFELERSQLEKQAVDARLALLQAQIEPHFLFNTLANVQALVESNSPRAAEVLKSLIAYLRAAMPRLHEGQPTLGTELALVRAYLQLMQMRMPDRLAFEVQADPSLSTERFPPMALLTLVENAVRHGIDPSENGGRISVSAQRGADGTLHLAVSDTGMGLNPLAQPGTGLNNLRARLAAFFGPRAELVLEDQVPHGLRAEIRVPL